MNERPMTLEEEAAHLRAEGFEAKVVKGELRITLGERRREVKPEKGLVKY